MYYICTTTEQLSKTSTAPQTVDTGRVPVPIFSPVNDRIKITYTERKQMKEVRCKCGKLQCKATVGSVVETKCGCGKVETYKVAA